MTEQIFFDTDCLSAFLWTDQGSIVTQLYRGRIVIPQLVHDELSRVKDPSFCYRLGELINIGAVELWDIDISSEAFPLYREMTFSPEPGYKVIGKGEASALALAHHQKGIVASNNFKDVESYIKKLSLDYTTTSDILSDAHDSGIITEEEGNKIWADMLAENRWLGAPSFTDYLEKPYKPFLSR